MRSGLSSVPDGKFMAKIVIDANVMISAAFGGKPFEAVARALQEHDVFVSKSIVEELERVIKCFEKSFPQSKSFTFREGCVNLSI
jgi:predicted nucleic acid-binding protein